MIKNSDDLISAVAANLVNESVSTPASQKGKHKCEVCGANYTVDTEEYGEAVCPVCGTLTDGNTANGEVYEPNTINGLEELVDEYAKAIANEDFDAANEIAQECEEQDAKIVTESLANGGTAIMIEAYVKTVDANGNVKKVKVKTKKKRLTAGQKAALRKARKKSHTAAAKRSRKKAMKIRKRKGLSESVIAKNIGIMSESLGRTPSAPEISKMTNKVKLVMEALEFEESDKIEDIITDSFRARNIEVIDIKFSTQGKALIFDVILQDDPDEEIYLGEVADEVEHLLGNYVVAYEEPITNDEGDVEVRFVLVDNIGLDESLDDYGFVENDLDECGYIDEDEDSDEYGGMICEDDDDSDLDDYDSDFENDYDDDNDDFSDTNESVLVDVGDDDDEAMDVIAGGQDNILCEIDPQFLKIGQTAYDADDKTVFTILSAPVESDEGLSFTADIVKSANQELAILPRGTRITITPDSQYYLLRKAPTA